METTEKKEKLIKKKTKEDYGIVSIQCNGPISIVDCLECVFFRGSSNENYSDKPYMLANPIEIKCASDS